MAGLVAIGKISFISGVVTAVNSAGDIRILSQGDPVYSGEKIITNAGESRVMITFSDNTTLAIAKDEQVVLDADVFDPENLALEENTISHELLQQALLDNPDFDVTSELEATAASESETLGSSVALPVNVTHDLINVDYDYRDTTGTERNETSQQQNEETEASLDTSSEENSQEPDANALLVDDNEQELLLVNASDENANSGNNDVQQTRSSQLTVNEEEGDFLQLASLLDDVNTLDLLLGNEEPVSFTAESSYAYEDNDFNVLVNPLIEESLDDLILEESEI